MLGLTNHYNKSTYRDIGGRKSKSCNTINVTERTKDNSSFAWQWNVQHRRMGLIKKKLLYIKNTYLCKEVIGCTNSLVMQIKNIDGKSYTMQACYVNFNPKIYNGNIHVFFYNLVILNKRILCQGDGKLKIGGGHDFLPGYLSSLIFHF